MAQVSNFPSEDPKVTNPSDQPEEGKSNSLLSKVKGTAKDTVRKLKNKVKKGSDDSSEDKSGSPRSDDWDESSSEARRESKEVARSPGTDEVEEERNGSERKVSFEGISEEGILSPFARSGADENAPLIASPTTYNEQQNNVTDFMPPSVIEPTSVSELGEESSSDLGNIPEAKDEEKAAVKEVQEGGPDSDINKGFKDTFQQKDLQAIDGLPKPRGFDDDNESSVKSNDLRFQGSEDLSDETPLKETENNAEEAYKGGEREFPVDGSTAGLDKDNEKPHPPGSMAEFKDSMFSSGAIHGMKPNEPNAAEAKHANEVGTFSRDFDPQANKSSSHPPAADSELHDNMFSTAIASDLKPSQTDEPTSTNTTSEAAGAPIGDVSREGGSEGTTTNFHDAPKDLPPPALADDHMDDNQKNESSYVGVDDGSYDRDNMPITAEEEAENYFDALSDDGVLASQSLDSYDSKDFNPEVTAEYNEQRDSLSESASNRIEAAEKEEIAAKKAGSENKATGGTSALTSALRSVVGALGS